MNMALGQTLQFSKNTTRKAFERRAFLKRLAKSAKFSSLISCSSGKLQRDRKRNRFTVPTCNLVPVVILDEHHDVPLNERLPVFQSISKYFTSAEGSSRKSSLWGDTMSLWMTDWCSIQSHLCLSRKKVEKQSPQTGGSFWNFRSKGCGTKLMTRFSSSWVSFVFLAWKKSCRSSSSGRKLHSYENGWGIQPKL